MSFLSFVFQWAAQPTIKSFCSFSLSPQYVAVLLSFNTVRLILCWNKMFFALFFGKCALRKTLHIFSKNLIKMIELNLVFHTREIVCLYPGLMFCFIVHNGWCWRRPKNVQSKSLLNNTINTIFTMTLKLLTFV